MFWHSNNYIILCLIEFSKILEEVWHQSDYANAWKRSILLKENQILMSLRWGIRAKLSQESRIGRQQLQRLRQFQALQRAVSDRKDRSSCPWLTKQGLDTIGPTPIYTISTTRCYCRCLGKTSCSQRIVKPRPLRKISGSGARHGTRLWLRDYPCQVNIWGRYEAHNKPTFLEGKMKYGFSINGSDFSRWMPRQVSKAKSCSSSFLRSWQTWSQSS